MIRVRRTGRPRWVKLIGAGIARLVFAKAVRRRLFTVPRRVTRGGRRQQLHLPARWPWATGFRTALARLRAIPVRC
ncbi:MAG: hypothetical protein ACR2LQ_03115 [Acidimicrobiales bacterium]